MLSVTFCNKVILPCTKMHIIYLLIFFHLFLQALFPYIDLTSQPVFTFFGSLKYFLKWSPNEKEKQFKVNFRISEEKFSLKKRPEK